MSDTVDAPPADSAAPAAAPTLEPLPDGGQRLTSPRESALKAFMARLTRPKEPAPAAPLPDVAAPAPAPVVAAAADPSPLADMQARDRAAKASEARIAEMEAKLAAAEQAEARRKADPIAALKDLGYTYEDLTRGIVEGKYKALTPEQVALDATKSEVQQLREKLEALEATRSASLAEESRAGLADAISAKLAGDDVASKLPVLAALPWASQHLAQYYEANPEADLDAYASQLDAQATADMRASLGSDRALKALLSDESIKARIASALGLAPKASPAAAIPGFAATQHGSRRTQSRAVTDEERKQNAIRALKRQSA